MAAKTASPKLVNTLYMVGSVILLALSIPLYLEKIGPNAIYGFRTAKTMSNPTIWYAANKVLGLDLLLAALVLLATTIGIATVGKRLTTNQVACINLGVVLVTLAAVFAHSFTVVGRM